MMEERDEERDEERKREKEKLGRNKKEEVEIGNRQALHEAHEYLLDTAILLCRGVLDNLGDKDTRVSLNVGVVRPSCNAQTEASLLSL